MPCCVKGDFIRTQISASKVSLCRDLSCPALYSFSSRSRKMVALTVEISSSVDVKKRIWRAKTSPTIAVSPTKSRVAEISSCPPDATIILDPSLDQKSSEDSFFGRSESTPTSQIPVLSGLIIPESSLPTYQELLNIYPMQARTISMSVAQSL